jgi:hypothetical protein
MDVPGAESPGDTAKSLSFDEKLFARLGGKFDSSELSVLFK